MPPRALRPYPPEGNQLQEALLDWCKGHGLYVSPKIALGVDPSVDVHFRLRVQARVRRAPRDRQGVLRVSRGNSEPVGRVLKKCWKPQVVSAGEREREQVCKERRGQGVGAAGRVLFLDFVF